jgi:hypothetical protein
MPPRNTELPEGTDHIINGAMETGGAAGGGGASSGGGTRSGFIGSAAGDGTGGTGGGGQAMTAESGTGEGSEGGVVDQLRTHASSLRGQAGERVRDFADSGKTRATDALDGLSQVVSDAAESIDRRMGADYGEYARRASDAVSTFADTLRRKEVDELYDDLRSAVRKSPAVAIGIAAVVGFTLVRLVKAGLAGDEDEGGSAGGGTTSAGGRG